MLQRRAAVSLFSRNGTGVPSCWLLPCVPVVSSAPVSQLGYMLIKHFINPQVLIHMVRDFLLLSIPTAVSYHHMQIKGSDRGHNGKIVTEKWLMLVCLTAFNYLCVVKIPCFLISVK